MKSSKLVITLLVAIAVSLVINFTGIIQLMDNDMVIETRVRNKFENARPHDQWQRGVFRVDSEGHGIVLTEKDDTINVVPRRVEAFNLKQGRELLISQSPTKPNNHTISLRANNQQQYFIHMMPTYNFRVLDVLLQLFYYMLLSFVVIQIATSDFKFGSLSGGRFNFLLRIVIALIVAIMLVFVAPEGSHRNMRIIPNFMSERILDYMLMFRWIFVVVVSLLYSHIYRLISQRQTIMLENEMLRSENLSNQYNMLMGQVNPHFFFNSLNSLSMLVREGDQERSLTYIDQLSYTFRYIIMNGQSTLTTLGDEMRFAEAYIYLFKIRYADKLFFDISIPQNYYTKKLPALSLQPLLDNAVKHNTITRSKPFHVDIRVEGDELVISNKKIAKLVAEPSTGIGLKNLVSRYRLITGVSPIIEQDDERFVVRLPLLDHNFKSTIHESCNC